LQQGRQEGRQEKGDVTVFTRVLLPRPFRLDPLAIHALDYCIGQQTEQETVVHIRGRCDGDVAFAGCLIVGEGQEEAVCDIKTYGEPRDSAALAAAVAACLADRNCPHLQGRKEPCEASKELLKRPVDKGRLRKLFQPWLETNDGMHS
jgi:hypothetical protein